MIGMLTGTIILLTDSFVILSVYGVGYKVFLPQSMLTSLQKGQEVTVFTHTHVREDMLELYGFASYDDLWLFEQLISVSGIGCKTAMGVFSVGARSEVFSAIASSDTSFFEMVPRLGKKNAQKIIIELKNKVGSLSEVSLADGNEQGDLITVLTGFGFSLKEAREAIIATRGKTDSPEDHIKLALKHLGR